MAIYTPLLKWYLAHGLVVTKTYSFIKASPGKPFQRFVDGMTDARREGDCEDEAKQQFGSACKLVLNSAYGRCGMNQSKHKEVSYATDETKLMSLRERPQYFDNEELEGCYEVSMRKCRVILANPIHLNVAILQLAKLRMLEFYYDCLDFYFDRSTFQYQEMDTDSAYIAFSDDQLFPNLVKPELREHFEKHKYDWFPRNYDEQLLKYDKRTPGLFKEEWRGGAIMSLSSKNYYCFFPDGSHKEKFSSKGVQKSGGRNADVLNADAFESVIKNKVTLQATNRGFRVCKQTKGIISYTQTKTGLSYYYDKRQVQADGISTIPLDI